MRRNIDWGFVALMSILGVLLVIIVGSLVMAFLSHDHSNTQCTVIIISKTLYPVCG